MCEDGIEKIIPCDHCLSSLDQPCDANQKSWGRISLSHPQTHDGFLYSILLEIVHSATNRQCDTRFPSSDYNLFTMNTTPVLNSFILLSSQKVYKSCLSFVLQNLLIPCLSSNCMLSSNAQQWCKVLCKSLTTNTFLTLNAPIATKVVCFSHLPECLRSLYGKQCGPRSDCSYRSSLFWIHAVCFNTQFIGNVRLLFAADDLRRQHFQMHFFLGALRVNNKVETETNSDVNMVLTAIALLASCTVS